MPDMAWIRVTLHDGTEIEECEGKELLKLQGDSIILCTIVQLTELEKLVDFEWLCSDGIIEINTSEINIYSCIPPILDDCKCFEIVWD